MIDIKKRFIESAEVKQNIAKDESLIEEIRLVSLNIVNTLNQGNKVILCGNGGSAADAQHIAAELLGKFYLKRKALPAICLNTNVSVLTAIANDYSYDDVFSRQVEGIGKKGDMFIGISTSGNSKNVVNAVKKCKELGIKTICLTGQSGGDLKNISDVCICVPSISTPRIQEAHITIGHIICEIVEKEMFSN